MYVVYLYQIFGINIKNLFRNLHFVYIDFLENQFAELDFHDFVGLFEPFLVNMDNIHMKDKHQLQIASQSFL